MRLFPVNPKAAATVDGVLRRMQFALLPAHCLLCGRRGEGERDLCAACRADLAPNVSACARCALPLPVPAALCGECLKREPPFDAAFAPFIYAHPLDLLMTKLKFGHSLAAGRVLTELWTAALRDALASGHITALPQAIVPMPLHAARLRERGYNQALELARPLAATIGCALLPQALVRTRATPAQAELDAPTRRKNLRGAFALDEIEFKRHAKTLDHVVVLDDVMTTGATLRECAATLKRAGVARVDVWALARAPRRR